MTLALPFVLDFDLGREIRARVSQPLQVGQKKISTFIG
jgi:hypothetical protein